MSCSGAELMAASRLRRYRSPVSAFGARSGTGHAVGEQPSCRAPGLPRYWADDRRRIPLTTAGRTAAERAWAGVRRRLPEDAVAALGPAEGDAFLARVEVALEDVHAPLALLYGGEGVATQLLDRALRIVLDAAAARPDDLRRLDRRREIDPGWFQRPRMQGYVCYVDRFCGRLDQLPGRLDYLGELGTTYLHLMPLLPPA